MRELTFHKQRVPRRYRLASGRTNLPPRTECLPMANIQFGGRPRTLIPARLHFVKGRVGCGQPLPPLLLKSGADRRLQAVQHVHLQFQERVLVVQLDKGDRGIAETGDAGVRIHTVKKIGGILLLKLDVGLVELVDLLPVAKIAREFQFPQAGVGAGDVEALVSSAGLRRRNFVPRGQAVGTTASTSGGRSCEQSTLNEVVVRGRRRRSRFVRGSRNR